MSNLREAANCCAMEEQNEKCDFIFVRNTSLSLSTQEFSLLYLDLGLDRDKEVLNYVGL